MGGIQWIKLEELCKFVVGGDVPKTSFSKEKTKYYNIPIYSNGVGENALYGYTDKSKVNSVCVTLAARGTIGYATFRTEPFYPIIRLICLIPNEQIIGKYLYYCVQKTKFKIPTTGIPQLTVPMAKEYKIPVPPLDVQQRIVDVLDNFEKICTDLKIGLPAEINARQKQYEYYRDLLLNFDCSQFVNVERERERERRTPFTT